MILRCMLIGMAIGVAAELLARVLGLWVYHQPQTPLLNIVLMFGMIMGGIAAAAPRIGLDTAFVVAFAIGLAYEIANLQVLKWWDFPEQRLGFIRGHTAIVLVIALLWGALPVTIAVAYAVLPKLVGPAAPPQSRLERLAEREKLLLEKLEAVRQRERDLQSRLDEVRATRQALQARQAVRAPGATQEHAGPTP